MSLFVDRIFRTLPKDSEEPLSRDYKKILMKMIYLTTYLRNQSPCLLKETAVAFLVMFGINTLQSQQTTELDSTIRLFEKAVSDTARVRHAADLAMMYFSIDPNESFEYAKQAVELNGMDDLNPHLSDALFAKGGFFYHQSNLDSAYKYVELATDISLEIGDTAGYISRRMNLGNILLLQAEFDKAILLYDDLDVQAAAVGDKESIAVLKRNRGSVYKVKGFEDLALRQYYAALKDFEALEYHYMQAECKLSIGIIYEENKAYKESIRFMSESIALYELEDIEIQKVGAITFLALPYMGLGHIDSALLILEQAKTIADSLELDPTLRQIYQFRGDCYDKQGNYEQAINDYLKSYEICKKEGFLVGEGEVLMDLGALYLKTGQLRKAQTTLDKAIAIGQQADYASLSQGALYDRSRVFQKLGQFRLALADMEAYKVINDSIFTLDMANKKEELNIIYETEKKETALIQKQQEVKTLEQEVKISRLQKTLFGGGLIGSLVLFSATIFGIRQKHKNEALKQAAKEAQVQQELDFKKKELTSLTLHLVQKNKFIHQVSKDIEELKPAKDGFIAAKNKIMTRLKIEPELNKDWELFKSFFVEVHNHFDKKLKELCPSINENEMRLAYLLKMRLNTAEIAAILHIIPESVRKSKYRLKKKLGLSKEDDLVQKLSEI